MKNYFDEIVSINNIKEAYNDLKEKFYNPMSDYYALSKLARGIDGDCFSIFQRHSNKKFKTIREELLSYQPSLPSIDLSIPKSSNPNKFRVISISSFKEKIKHQAVCRVIEPVLESLYTDNLYSYRQGRGAYNAIKAFRKHILFDDEEYYIYKADLKDYFDNLDHPILLKIVDKVFKDPKLTDLIEVFLKQQRITSDSILESNKGVVQGIAISSHLANLYLLELDKKMNDQGIIYFRVGDDIIVMEKDKDKLKKIADYVENFLVKARNLPINFEKTEILSPNDSFEYLGYEFKGKNIRIAKRNCNKMKQKLRVKLNKKFTAHLDRSTVDQDLLLNEILTLIYPGKRIPDHVMWLRYFTLINDTQQLKEMDDLIETRIRLLFFGKKRNKNITQLPLKKLHKHNYVSLTKIYFDLTHGRKSFHEYVRYFTYKKQK